MTTPEQTAREIAKSNDLDERLPKGIYDSVLRSIAAALRKFGDEKLEEAETCARSYLKDTHSCGDECLAVTVVSDIVHDIRVLKEKP